MKREINTPLADDYIKSLQDISAPETDEFFYTRLKARMEADIQPGWSLPVKPAWLIGSLLVMISVNGLLLFNQKNEAKQTTAGNAALQQVANDYDLSITSSY